MDKFARRRKHVSRKMQEENMEYILVSGAFNRYYLSGFELGDPQCNESAGYLLLGQDEAFILPIRVMSRPQSNVWAMIMLLFTVRINTPYLRNM